MILSAKQAANAVGMTKQGLINAIKNGSLSATKNDKGYWEIESSELFRAFPDAKSLDTDKHQENTATSHQLPPTFDTYHAVEMAKSTSALEAAHQEIAMLKSSLQDSKDRERDLSEKLDKAHSILEHQTLLLTDRTDKRPYKILGIIPVKR